MIDRVQFKFDYMLVLFFFVVHVLSIYSRFLLIIFELSSYNSTDDEDDGINGRSNNDQKVTRTNKSEKYVYIYIFLEYIDIGINIHTT